MAVAMALFEASSLFIAACGGILLWGHPLLTGWPGVASILDQALVLSFCCLIAFYFTDLYDLRTVRSLGEYGPRLLQSVGIALVLVVPVYALFPDTRITERRFVSSLLIMVGLVVALRAVSYSLMRSRPFTERVLMVGASPLTTSLIREIEAQPHRRYTIVGVVDDTKGTGEIPAGYPLLGPLAHLDRIIEEVHPDRVIVGLSERRGRLPLPLLLESRVRGVRVEDGARTYERLAAKLAIESLTPSLLVFSDDFRRSRLDAAVGRGVSLLASAVGLIVLAPLFGLIALAIKVDSAGPVFFIHERVGLGGRRLRLIKFRTMHPVSGKTSEWVVDNSNRITRVGKWLRQFRLDELPQFVNILKGEMNLVGPRPHPVSNVELFSERIPYYSLRALVRPGVTGWAQIQYGYANNLEEEIEKMRYDLFYIKHRSLGFDLRILFETVKFVLFGREGAPHGLGGPLELLLQSAPRLRRQCVLRPPVGPQRADVPEVKAQEAEAVTIINALSVDVEEYYHALVFREGAGDRFAHGGPSRVEESVERVLGLLDDSGARATFFTLGEVAKAHPAIVRKIAGEGHEVACHGYRHERVSGQTPATFRADVRRAKGLLEDLCSHPVLGYRAPNFSIGRTQTWAYEVLVDEGFQYDSSTYPILHDRYGDVGACRFPFQVFRSAWGTLVEFPIGTLRILGVNVPIGGGGYFRLLPVGVTRFGIRRVNACEGQPVMFYFHPWELDVDQPRPPMPWRYRVRHYIGMDREERKLAALLRACRFGTAREVLGLR